MAVLRLVLCSDYLFFMNERIIFGLEGVGIFVYTGTIRKHVFVAEKMDLLYQQTHNPFYNTFNKAVKYLNPCV